MRLASEFWIKAFVRTCNGAGAAAFIVRRGDQHGGSIFVRINRLDGTSQIYGPAAAGLADVASQRRFELRVEASDDEVDRLIAREVGFDSDLWVIEVEDRDGRHFLDDWLIASE
ncbi:MAG: DUF1491 family protein [Alphaproteobacteria bacterium]|nr:DUF1491 family protein [Alphaproteobacteria bacterium]